MGLVERAIVSAARSKTGRAVLGSAVELIARSYEAATIGRRAGSLSRATGKSQNAETAYTLKALRDRHRHLRRNNPWAYKAGTAIVTNTVGYGITGTVLAPDGDERASTKKRVQQLNRILHKWANSTVCDADGVQTLFGLQRLSLDTTVEAGEVLFDAQFSADRRLAVPLKIRIREPDYIDETKDQPLGQDGVQIIQGVQYRNGVREGYWLFESHPGDYSSRGTLSRLVKSGYTRTMYEQVRPGQVRGVPWGVACYLTLEDLDGFEDAYLLRQKIANCFTVFLPTGARGYESANPVTGRIDIVETIEPGRVELIPPGSEPKFANPPAGNDYGPYTRDVLYRVAAAYRLSHVALTGDLTDVNFSSAKVGERDFGRQIEMWQWQMMQPQFLEPIGDWFLEAMALKLGVDLEGYSVKWTPPRRGYLDLSKEIPAIVEGIRAGVLTLEEEHASQGLNTDDVLDSIARTNQKIDDRKLILDCDPRKVGKTSTPAVAEAPV